MTTYSQYAKTIRPVSMYNDAWYSEDGSQWYEAIADIDKDDPELIWRARAGAIALVKGGSDACPKRRGIRQAPTRWQASDNP